MVSRADTLTLASGPLRAVLTPGVGGSIARFDHHDGAERRAILRGAEAPADALDAGCFPMIPYCNRIRGGRFSFRGREIRIAPNMAGDRSPLHGDGWLAPWEVEDADETTAELRYHHSPGEWPWAYEARQRFRLSADRLEVTLICTNRDAADMPCGLGLHPYFPCGSGTRLATRVAHVWTVDADVLPVERVPADGRYDLSGGPACGRGLDNGYDGWGGTALIEDRERPFAIEMSSADAGFFQLYSPESGGLFVAEPVSHANAALNAPETEWPALGLRVLAPGGTMRLTMTLTVVPAARSGGGARA